MLKIKNIVTFTLLLLTIAFIWGNSLLSGQQSHNVSSTVTEKVVTVVEKTLDIEVEPNFIEFIVRKSAHFIEFFILGLLIKSSLSCKFIFSSLFGISVASIDEFIQIFSLDRGPSITDICIDSCGAVLGIIVYTIILLLINKICSKKFS